MTILPFSPPVEPVTELAEIAAQVLVADTVTGPQQGLRPLFLRPASVHPMGLVRLKRVQLVPQLAEIKHVGC